MHTSLYTWSCTFGRVHLAFKEYLFVMQTRVHPSHKTLGVLFTSLFSRFLLSPLLAFLPFPVCTRPRVQLRSRNLMEKQDLDFVLVPLGLLSLVAYHLWLLYRITRHPTTTVIGINAINRRIWVQTMMEVSTSLFHIACCFNIHGSIAADLSAGSCKERSVGSPDSAEQHNGVDAVGVDGDHAQLADRRADDKRR